MATVRNINGTSGLLCACGSWLAHWFIGSGSRRTTCATLGCGGLADVGAHVHRVPGGDWTMYVVPLCFGCNRSPYDLDVGSVVLVPAATLRTCRAP